MQSNIQLKGIVTITVKDLEGNIIRKDTFKNKIPYAALNDIVNYRLGDSVDGEVKYLAWGNDNTPPLNDDETLGNELGRKPVTKKESVGNGVLEIQTFLSSQDANTQIEEIGWFTGNATDVANSGTLAARVLYSYEKTEQVTIQIDRTETYTEVA